MSIKKNAVINLEEAAKYNLKLNERVTYYDMLANRSSHDVEHPGLHELRLMRDPKYLFYAAKVLLNVNLLPIQAVILQELWTRPFPMLIGSRGFSKTWTLALLSMLKCALIPGSKIIIAGAAFRQSKMVFEYMSAMWRNADILRDIYSARADGPHPGVDQCTMKMGDSVAIAVPVGDGCLHQNTSILFDDCFGTIERDKQSIRNRNIWGNGNFNLSDESYDNGFKKTLKITTKKGYVVEGTPNHKLKVLRGQEIKWVRLDQMAKGDYLLIDRSIRWHNGQFNCSINDAYVLGAMVGGGCWTNEYKLRFTTKDKEFLPILNSVFDKDFLPCDEVHYDLNSKKQRADWLRFWKLKKCYTKDKYLPETILSAPRKQMSACLQGLFDTDGHVTVEENKGGVAVTIGLTNTSKKLIEQVQFILLHYGIICSVNSRKRKKNWNTVYELLIHGKNARFFAKKIGFRLTRKKTLLAEGIRRQKRNICMQDIIPNVKDDMLVIASSHRKFGYTHICANKIQDRKNITRNFANDFINKYEDVDHDFISRLKKLNNTDIYYDQVVSIEKSQGYTYDVHVPKTHQYCANGFYSHNTKIRGYRAHTVITDEFNSIRPDIFETVMQGFTVVSADPVGNVADTRRRQIMKDNNMWSEEQELAHQAKGGNQVIISGTAGYAFEHFSDYWKRYHRIIASKGDPKVLDELFAEDDDKRQHFDWRHYSIIRIPYDLIPKGFMDDKQVTRAKATVHSGTFLCEYGACFAKDSEGFYKRSLIDSCVASEIKPIVLPSGKVWFSPLLRGLRGHSYVIGVDPASERDNLAIVVLELHPDHTRIVYTWTTNKKDFKKRLSAGLTNEQDYNGFVVRKIRDLMAVFPTVAIGMDAQGGGYAIEEGLHDPEKTKQDESLIWQIIDPDKEKDTDDKAGLHILHMIQFAQADWTSKANHGMRKDFEDKLLLFPQFDSLSLAFAAEEDKETDPDKIYDTLEDCTLEIEELKNELCTIIMERTGSGVGGRERWETPEKKLSDGRKGRMRKDRYSALLIANAIAREIRRAIPEPEYKPVGGLAKNIDPSQHKKGRLYQGPNWWTDDTNRSGIGIVVPKNR